MLIELVRAHSMLTGRCEAGVDDVSQLSVKLKLLQQQREKESEKDRWMDG